ncbi:hypothetical protein LCGC14_2939210, partial [marine sediment metagenome]
FGLIPFLLIAFPLPDLGGTAFSVLSITDTESIRVILSFVIGGIFTLTIFSYTMVMSVLNRSINNYSPRLIPLLLSERHHQIILGVTSGTIIYVLILAVISASDANFNFPKMGATLAIFFTMVCVLLFIYFVHSVSQTIHINYILKRSYLNTKKNINKLVEREQNLFQAEGEKPHFQQTLKNFGCGYLNGFRMKRLACLAEKYDLTIQILASRGDFVYDDESYLALSRKVDESLKKKIEGCFNIDHDEPLEVTEIGFKHLVEVAIKGSSPSINDPGTSVSCIDYLTQLFGHYLLVEKFNAYQLNGTLRIYIKHTDIDVLFKYCFAEMYRYMKDDPVLIVRLKRSIEKIEGFDTKNRLKKEIINLKKTTNLYPKISNF